MQEILKKSLTTFGNGPAKCYRIPGIIVTQKGTILTYCEMRLDGGDWLTRGIGLFRSEDEGATWSPIRQIVTTDRDEAINNPVMIAGRDGTVHFLWQTDYCHGYYQRSDDDGQTFTSPVDITAALNSYSQQKGFHWNVFAFGPGHGIELEDGRLLVPIWMANGGEKSHAPSVVSTLCSSDGGTTWETGDIIFASEGFENPNETCAVQLQNGSVMLNIRHHGSSYLRGVTISPDGLTHFSPIHFDPALPDPICFGSICRIRSKDAGNLTRLLFLNCATMPNKENNYSCERRLLTLRLSQDEGKTWFYSRLLEAHSGYSDVAASPDGTWIYCFYEHDIEDETDLPRHLTFARMNLEWLTDGTK